MIAQSYEGHFDFYAKLWELRTVSLTDWSRGTSDHAFCNVFNIHIMLFWFPSSLFQPLPDSLASHQTPRKYPMRVRAKPSYLKDCVKMRPQPCDIVTKKRKEEGQWLCTSFGCWLLFYHGLWFLLFSTWHAYFLFTSFDTLLYFS